MSSGEILDDEKAFADEFEIGRPAAVPFEIGAVAGLAGKAGVDRSLRARVDGLLGPGKSALVVMTRKLTEDKFAAGMAEFGGTILKTSLSDDAEKELAGELGN